MYLIVKLLYCSSFIRLYYFYFYCHMNYRMMSMVTRRTRKTKNCSNRRDYRDNSLTDSYNRVLYTSWLLLLYTSAAIE